MSRFPADAFCTFATIVAMKQNMTPAQRQASLAKACGISLQAVYMRLRQARKVGIRWKELETGRATKRVVSLKVISKKTAPALKRLINRTKRKMADRATV
jgi:hypothetical protein